MSENNIIAGEFLRKYNQERRENILSFELTNHIKFLIACTHTTTSNKDNAIWTPNPKGSLTTNSVYKYLTNSPTSPTTNDFYWIWALKCPNKIKYFIWLCKHNRIST